MKSLVNIPAKSTFKQNEVCQITGVKPYVLKFWEEQFDEIDPIVSATGKKLYEHNDIQAIAVVKKLLFEEKMTVDQAKQEIKLRLAPATATTTASQEPEQDQDQELIPAKQQEDQAQEVQDKLQEKVLEERREASRKLEAVTEALKQEVPESERDSQEIALDKQVDADLCEFEKSLEQDLLDQVIESKAQRPPRPVVESLPVRENKSNRSILCAKDKQKLVLAKAKLQNMLMIAGQIKSRENIQ